MIEKFLTKIAQYNGLCLGLMRILVGFILLYHGFGKVQGDFALGLFTKLGYPAPMFFGYFISFLELIGGFLLMLGLFTRHLGTAFSVLFLVATYTKWIAFRGGYNQSEFELLLLIACTVFATGGAGRLSLGNAIFGKRFR